MRASLHINVVIFFEFLLPMVIPLAIIFIAKPNSENSNETAFIFIMQVVGLYILGRFIGRKIPATCNTCFSKITPEGTSLIVYHCKKCGYKYSKRINSTDHYHNNNH